MPDPKIDIKIQAHVEVGEMRKMEESIQRQIVQMRLAGAETSKLAAKEAELLAIRKKLAALPQKSKIAAAAQEAASSIPGVGPIFTALNGSTVGIAAGIAGITTALVTMKRVIQGTFEGLRSVADFGGKMSDLGAQTGQSARDVVVLDQAFRNAGLGSEAVGQSINLLQKALTGVNEEGQPTSAVFSRLGLSINALKSMSALDALGAISEKIAGLKTPADQTRAAMEIFGRSGGRMLALLKDDKAFETARTMVGELAANIGESVQALDNFSDSLGALETKKLQFFAGFAKGLGVEDLQKAADAINKIDLSKLGGEFANIASGIRLTAQELANFATKANSLPGANAFQDWIKALPVGGILAQDALQYFRVKGKKHQIAAALDASDLFDQEAWKKRKTESAPNSDIEASIQDSRDRAEADRQRRDAARKSEEEVIAADKFKDMSPEQKVEDISARRAKLGEVYNSPSTEENERKKALEESNKLLAEELDLRRQINAMPKEFGPGGNPEDIAKAKATHDENVKRQKALELELKIAEAIARGDKAAERGAKWEQSFQAALDKGKGAGMDDKAADVFATKSANAGEKPVDPLAEARKAMNVSSMARLGMAVGESSGAAPVVDALREMIVKQQKADSQRDKLIGLAEAISKKKTGWQ